MSILKIIEITFFTKRKELREKKGTSVIYGHLSTEPFRTLKPYTLIFHFFIHYSKGIIAFC